MQQDEKDQLEMFVAGLVLDPTTNAPIVILKDEGGGVCLPIWIGLAEATSIATAMKKIEMSRPMTHDLLSTVIQNLGGRVQRVYIRDVANNTFMADIDINVENSIKTIDARPSDAIAIAVRVGVPIFVSHKVLAQVQVNMVAVDPSQAGSIEGQESPDSPTGLNFSMIDKDKWADLLAQMDPDDFKYKM